MLEGSGHPEALTGVLPWHVWLLRWGGTGTTSSCRNALTALKIDVKARRIDQAAADAVRSFVGELMFSSPLDPAIVRDAFEAVEPMGDEHAALQLMWKDVVATGRSVTTPDVRAAMELADEVSETIGRTVSRRGSGSRWPMTI